MAMTKYTFKKGNHYPNPRRFGFSIGRNIKMTRAFMFPETAKYLLHYPDNLDLNKLFGFSDGLNHHINSIRIGWRYEPHNDVFELFAYQYIDGKRKMQKLGDVKQTTPVHVTIEARKGFYLIKMKKLKSNTEFMLPRNSNHWLHFHLHPYFGGNLTAPKELNLYLWK